MTRLMITADWCQTCKAIKPVAEEEGYTIVNADVFETLYPDVAKDVGSITTLPVFVAYSDEDASNYTPCIHRGAMTVHDVRRFGS